LPVGQHCHQSLFDSEILFTRTQGILTLNAGHTTPRAYVSIDAWVIAGRFFCCTGVYVTSNRLFETILLLQYLSLQRGDSFHPLEYNSGVRRKFQKTCRPHY
jgi:hypothetical protein